MTSYYFDIETTGLNPETSTILTIQFQKLDFRGLPTEDLVILKSWESSEKEILEQFVKKTDILNKHDSWIFVPVGYNLPFEAKFLSYKFKKYEICDDFNLLDKPYVDLFQMAIIFNQGKFKGTGLDKVSGKQGDGFQVIEAYSFGDYDKIVGYVEMETREFLRLYRFLLRNCTKFKGYIFPDWK